MEQFQSNPKRRWFIDSRPEVNRDAKQADRFNPIAGSNVRRAYRPHGAYRSEIDGHNARTQHRAVILFRCRHICASSRRIDANRTPVIWQFVD
jgi:hypothetical protein